MSGGVSMVCNDGFVAGFEVVAERCPGVPCRVLGLFAQQDRIPRRADVADDGDSLRVVVEVELPDRRWAEQMAERMRSMVRVRSVSLDAA